jgi:hypothetical protein
MRIPFARDVENTRAIYRCESRKEHDYAVPCQLGNVTLLFLLLLVTCVPSLLHLSLFYAGQLCSSVDVAACAQGAKEPKFSRHHLKDVKPRLLCS